MRTYRTAVKPCRRVEFNAHDWTAATLTFDLSASATHKWRIRLAFHELLLPCVWYKYLGLCAKFSSVQVTATNAHMNPWLVGKSYPARLAAPRWDVFSPWRGLCVTRRNDWAGVRVRTFGSRRRSTVPRWLISTGNRARATGTSILRSALSALTAHNACLSRQCIQQHLKYALSLQII